MAVQAGGARGASHVTSDGCGFSGRRPGGGGWRCVSERSTRMSIWSSADLVGDLLIGEAGDMSCRQASYQRGFLMQFGGFVGGGVVVVAGDVDAFGVVGFEDGEEEEGDGVFFEVGGDVADFEFAVGVAVVGVGADVRDWRGRAWRWFQRWASAAMAAASNWGR